MPSAGASPAGGALKRGSFSIQQAATSSLSVGQGHLLVQRQQQRTGLPQALHQMPCRAYACADLRIGSPTSAPDVCYRLVLVPQHNARSRKMLAPCRTDISMSRGSFSFGETVRWWHDSLEDFLHSLRHLATASPKV